MIRHLRALRRAIADRHLRPSPSSTPLIGPDGPTGHVASVALDDPDDVVVIDLGGER